MAADATNTAAKPKPDLSATSVLTNGAPLEPPHPALAAAGVKGGIQEFNQRVQAVTDAYHGAYGTKPPPDVAFDVVRSPLAPDQFPALFKIPQTHMQARAKQDVNQHQAQGGLVDVTAKSVAAGILNAAVQGNLDAFLRKNADAVSEYGKNSAVAGALFKAKRLGAQREVDQKVNAGELSPVAGQQQLRAMGYLPGGATFKEPKGAFGEAAIAIGQIADSLAHSPGGVYQLGKAITLDASDLTHGDFTPDRTAAIAKQIGQSMWRDVRHPGENPGYLFLDALGLVSAGAGTAARVAAGGRAFAEGGVVAAAKTAARKPTTGTFQIGRAGAEENVVLSGNPAVAAAQRVILQRRQKNLDFTTINGEKTPGALGAIIGDAGAKDFLDEHLSFPAKVGREADARRRVEHTVAMTVARELDHVAGTSRIVPRVYGRLPAKARNGLTRGEQKAIWVAATDDATPLETNLAFHRRMIDLGIGDPKAHLRQIADLELARKALANPSARLTKALDLTRQVVGEMERRKIDDLGLSPVTAEGRVAKLGQVLRGDEVTAGEQVNPQSFYLPAQPRGKSKRPPSDRGGFYAAKAGPYGIPLPRDLPELHHEFTGKAIQAGDFRVDTTSLATEAYARTVRAATVLNEHQRLWKSAADTPRSKFDVPIRDSQKIPDKLRIALDDIADGGITPAEADALPADVQDLIHELYPPRDQVLRQPIEGVKWIDGRMLGTANEIPNRPGMLVKAMQVVNEPVRAVTLFLRPAYALNALGNTAMLVFHEGFAAVPSVARALAAPKTLGEDTVRAIDALMGQGRSKSYTSSLSTKASQRLAQAWNVVTDQAFRRASFLYEARKLGYDTPEKLRELVKQPSKDLVEATRRGNKALVEFDNLTPFEKNTLRNIIFVYPWTSRSAVYSLRAIMEHPLETALLAKLGEQEIDSDPIFKNAVDWFKRVGYFPVGWNHDGTPKVVNPTSVNTFSVLNDLTALAGAGLGPTKYSSISDLFGPSASVLVHGTLGIDQYGNKYPDRQWLRAAGEVLSGLPQVAAFQRNQKTNPPLRPVDVRNRDSLMARLHSALHRTVLSPGWLGGYGTLVAGGLSPRGYDPQASEARYWRDQTAASRHKLEVTLLDKALGIQADLLKTTVPADVRDAVNLGSNIAFQYKQHLKETGRTPSEKEKASFALQYLASMGRVPAATAAQLEKQLAPLVDATDINAFAGKVFADYANGNALKEWDSDVRLVASFQKPVFEQKTRTLYQQGLVDKPVPTVTQEQLYDYGRKYLAFTKQVLVMRAQIKAGKATTADLRALHDANDRPVGGLPSFARVAWSYKSPEDQAKTLRQDTIASWSTLAALDKQLLGRPSDPKVSEAWATYTKSLAAGRESLPAGQRHLRTDDKLRYAKQLDRYYNLGGAFYKDVVFAGEPLYARLQTLKPIQSSPNKSDWGVVLGVASEAFRTHKNDPQAYPLTRLRDQWRDYIASPDFQAWLNSRPAFKAEVNSYSRTLLQRLLG